MSTASNPLTFDEIADFLLREASFHSPSGLHGFIVGHIAGGGQSPDAVISDIKLFLSLDQLSNDQALNPFYQSVMADLQDEDLNFAPVLPDDEESLPRRLQALAYWCEGFLSGFALNELAKGKLDKLVSETLNDYAAIAQIDSEDDMIDDDSEKDYIDIIEFIRVSALNIFMEYRAKETKGDVSSKTHPLFQSKKLH